MTRSPGRLSGLLIGCVLLVGVGGCAGDASEQASPTGTTPPPGATASPTPSPPPSGTLPTVEGLEEHLGGLIASTTDPLEWQAVRRPPGVLSCEGSGPLTEGMAVRCDWRSQDPDASSGPVFVAVLDDSGRYTFSSRLGGFMSAMVVPSDHPAGTISCATLKQNLAVERDGRWYGMDYATVLHYWMSLGSPVSMDDDRNGLPCETVYPADVVARVAGSPLVVGGRTEGGPRTREQVRTHAEAVISGLESPGPLFDDGTPEGWGAWPTQTVRCGGEAPVSAGATLYCAAWRFDYVEGSRQHGGYLISVLDDTGRYTFAQGHCCGSGPPFSVYPTTSTCQQLTRLPSGYASAGWSDGLGYRTVVFAWMLQGSTGRWDADGDGRPCERAYSAEDVDAVFASSLRP